MTELAEEDIALLDLPQSIENDAELQTILNKITTNIYRYAANSMTCTGSVCSIASMLIERGEVVSGLRLYYAYMVAVQETSSSSAIAMIEFLEDQQFPIEMHAAQALFIITARPLSESRGIEMIDYLLRCGKYSVQQVLYVHVQSTVALDQYCEENSPVTISRGYHSIGRQKIMTYIYNHSKQKFLNFMKLSYVAMLNDVAQKKEGPANAHQVILLPQIYKEFLVQFCVKESKGDRAQLVEVLVASVCEVTSIRNDNMAALDIFAFLDQLAPTSIAAEVIYKQMTYSVGKSAFRRLAVQYLADRVEDICDEYDIIDLMHSSKDKNEVAATVPTISTQRRHSWGNTSNTTVNAVSVESHAQILVDAFITVWATVLDTIMLDPIETVRIGALVSASNAVGKTFLTQLAKINFRTIYAQYFEVMIMKCSDISEKIRTKSVTILLSSTCLNEILPQMEPDSFFHAVRNLFRVGNAN